MSIMNESYELNEDTESLNNRFLTFELGNETYGLEIRYVTEIIGIQEITQIPDLPSHIMGIINLRGKIIPVMDIRLRFRKEFNQYNDRTCIIVIEADEFVMGLIVDAVSEVILIDEKDIVDPPDTNTGFNSSYIKNIGKAGSKVMLLLDCDRLIKYEPNDNTSSDRGNRNEVVL